VSRSAALLLREILEAGALLERYTEGLTFEDFADDTEKQDAVIRRLLVLGEAVKGLPGELKARYADVPWREIAGARDIMVHEYFRVDLELAWDMVQVDLPDLVDQVSEILRAEGLEDEAL